MRRIFVLAIPVVVACVAGLLFAIHVFHSETPDGVIRVQSIQADIFYLDAEDIVKQGPPGVLVIRLDEPVELVPHSYDRAGFDGPETVGTWVEKLGVPLVFNAGQYDENLRHLGWLKAQDQWLSKYRKEQWKGLLLSGPIGHEGWSRLADLEDVDAKIIERYEHVVQSMMLVDHDGKIRVRESDRVACRSAIAEDAQGRLIFLMTQGATTLADFARWIPQSGLNIVRAMNLDGGVEAQVALRTPEFNLSMYGTFGVGSTGFPTIQGLVQYPIPNVIAVRPIRTLSDQGRALGLEVGE